MNTRSIRHLLSGATLALMPLAAFGQISLTGGNLSYTQDFNLLARTTGTGTASEAWVDNSNTASTNDPDRLRGLLGWYASFGGGQAVAIRAATGAATTSTIFSYGSGPTDNDRSLGGLPNDTIGSVRYGVRFVNNTGTTITGFTASFDGEQWRVAGNANPTTTNNPAVNNQIVMGYQIFNAGQGGLTAGTYTSVAGGTFDSIIDSNATSITLDGKDPANRIAGLGNTITGISVLPGQELWIRWQDVNSSFIDHSLAIDNFSFTAIPEPSAFASLAGLGALGLAALRRRRR